VRIDPERELVHRALPFGAPAMVAAAAAGLILSGPAAAVSAAIGIAVVVVNFVAQGYSLAWAAKISPAALAGVGVGGFVLRLTVIFAGMVGLNRIEWFSPVAFGAAVVPCTIALLIFEMKQLFGRLQVDLWNFERPQG